jgi:DnaJ-class molecular chaperone
MEKTAKQSAYYEQCTSCDGDGCHYEHCCSGIDSDGSISCGCYGREVEVECPSCYGTGKILVEDIEWDFETLEDEDTHDYQVYYSIEGTGITTGKKYVATAIYTCDELDEITDIELR